MGLRGSIISSLVKNVRYLYNKKRTTDAFDSKSDTVTFTTADVSSDSSATSWTSVSQLTSGLTHATLLNRISAMMKNVRYLYAYKPDVAIFYATNLSISVPAYSVVNYSFNITGLDSKLRYVYTYCYPSSGSNNVVDVTLQSNGYSKGSTWDTIYVRISNPTNGAATITQLGLVALKILI